MKLIILLFNISTFTCCLSAQNNFNISAIPDSLKHNANAVYLLDEGVIEVKSQSSYTFKKHTIISILNEDGLTHLSQSFGINKFAHLEKIQVKVYDSNGVEIKTYKKKDFSTQAYTDETTLLSDYKILYLQAFSASIPCTIEVESEEHQTSFIELPDWIISAPEESVINSVFTVKMQDNLDIRYNVKNISLPPPTVITENKFKIYKWVINNMKAQEYELKSFEVFNYLPKIQVVPQLFEYDGYKGSFFNWKDFGAWNYNLYQEENPFSSERVNEITALVKNKSNVVEKINTLYIYLKNNTRYVSIQLGIGGFKPFPVNFVDDKKYGDCKALTNYMRYLLKTIGINSYPALINAGYNKLPADVNFPADVFNHVILCVPLKNDTMWLECTSKNNECGVLGSFTENKKALLLTENGGILINTPLSKYTNNLIASKSTITLDENDIATTKSSFFYKGESGSIFQHLQQYNNDDQKLWLSQNLYFKNPDELQVEILDTLKNAFCTNANYEQLFNFKAAGKYFFPLKIFKFTENFATQNVARKLPYVFNYPYKKIDTTIYILGKNFSVESLPSKKALKNEYAEYEQNISHDPANNAITFITIFSLKKHIIPPKDYKELSNFFSAVNENENGKLIIKKL